MKRLLFLFFMLLVTAVTFAQVTDTTATVTYNFGDSFAKFLDENMWTLIFVAFTVISEWLGQTGKVKEGSIWAWVINMLGKLLRKKTEVVQTKKAKFLNPLILVFALMLSGITLTSFAQSPNRIFAPVENDLLFKMKANGTAVSANHVWLPRVAAGLTAAQMYYNKETKEWNTKSLNALAFGMGYQHFIQANDKPFNDFGFNLLLLIDILPTENTQTAFSTAATVSTLEYLNFGAGYNFTLKSPFLLTTITFDIAGLKK